jgi:hypothetical protein
VTTGEQLHEALVAIADLAPQPDRLRASLRRRIRLHRQRRTLMLASAAALGAGAVGIPAMFWLRGPRPASVESNMPTAAAEPTGSGNIRVPLVLRPTWLPEGTVEFSRAATRGAVEQRRVWATAAAIEALNSGDPDSIMGERWVSLRIVEPQPEPTYVPPSPEPTAPASAQRTQEPEPPRPPDTTVGGRPAWFESLSENLASLRWLREDGASVIVSVSAVEDPIAVAQRIADSVTTDEVAGCETSLRLNWLPPEASQVWDIEVTGWGGGWTQSILTRATPSTGQDWPIWAQLATDRSLLGSSIEGDPVTLRDRPGIASSSGGYGQAAVELDGGRWLRVLCYAMGSDQRDCAIRVINDIELGPDPYVGWVGHR